MRAMSDPNQFPPTPPPSWGAQQPGYGYGQAAMPTAHPQGTTILVLGILGLVICSPLGIAAWVMGNKAQAEMAAQPGVMFTNQGQIKAGKICGIIASVLLVLGVILVIVTIVAGSSSS
jgi:ABC-type Fe3+ transport system permease subunit